MENRYIVPNIDVRGPGFPLHVGVFYWFLFHVVLPTIFGCKCQFITRAFFLESKFVFAVWLNWVGITGQLFNGRIVYRFFPQNISLYTFHGQNAASNSGKIIAMKVLNKSNSNPRVRLGDFVAILTEGRTSTYLPRRQNGHCEPFHRRNRPIQRRDAGSISPATRQRGSHCRIGVQNVVLLCFHSRWFRLCCFSNLGRFPIFSRYRERTVPFAGRERKKERERKRERHDSKKPTDQLPE